MDTTLFLIVLLFTVLVIVGLVYLVVSPSSYKGIKEEKEEKEEAEDVKVEDEPQNRGRGLSRMNVRNRRQGNNNNNNNNNNATTTTTTTATSTADVSDESSDDDSDEQIGDTSPAFFKKMGTKKMEKLKRKEKRRKTNEFMAQQREEAKKKREEIDEREKQRRAERDEKERLEKEEEDRIRLEQEKKETEEYNLLKAGISLEESGEATNSEEKEKSLLQAFINYLKEHKMVLLEDVAMEFDMKTLEVVERIKALDKQGMISGVIDDRGKFIYISKEELDSVVKFINKKGRVNIETIAFESNKLIDLNPKIIVEEPISTTTSNEEPVKSN